MEFLNILKKHYEKVVLSVVLLGLTIAAAMLVLQVASEKERLDSIRNLNLTTAPRELEPTDVSTNLVTLARLERPPSVILSGTNNLFNPVRWQRESDGRLVKIVHGNETGAGALDVLAIKPLYLVVSYEGQVSPGDITQYQFRIERQAEKNVGARRPMTLSFTSIGSRNSGFALKDMAPPQNPNQFLLEIIGSKTEIPVSANQEYRAVAGYSTDLRYEPEKRSFLDRRLEDRLVFAGDTNKIVAITQTNVTVEASNRKRTTIAYHAAARSASP
jgi:hypothetical protein